MSGSEPPGKIDPRSGTVPPPGRVSSDPSEEPVEVFDSLPPLLVAVVVLVVALDGVLSSSSPQATNPTARTAGRRASRARFMRGSFGCSRAVEASEPGSLQPVGPFVQ